MATRCDNVGSTSTAIELVVATSQNAEGSGVDGTRTQRGPFGGRRRSVWVPVAIGLTSAFLKVPAERYQTMRAINPAGDAQDALKSALVGEGLIVDGLCVFINQTVLPIGGRILAGTARRALLGVVPDSPVMQRLSTVAVGSCALTVAHTLSAPLTIRLSGIGGNVSMLQIAKSTYAGEGGFARALCGLLASFGYVVTYRGTAAVMHEVLGRSTRSKYAVPLSHLIAAVVAGAVDQVRRRAVAEGISTIEATKTIYKEAGITGFFAGVFEGILAGIVASPASGMAVRAVAKMVPSS